MHVHDTLYLCVYLCVCLCDIVCVCVSDVLQTSDGVDWRGELLAAVQQVFVRERSVLKSALYARLDLLDTSDAVIHLNQLERSLAELVSNKDLSM